MPTPSPANTPLIGVLALQGAFQLHADRLAHLGARTRLVRLPDDLHDLNGLIIPGGESTTFLKHLQRAGFYDQLYAFAAAKPTFGTCAGAILLARHVLNPPQPSFGLLDATITRNAYGRQLDSAIRLEPTTLPGGPLEAVYIRAPQLQNLGPEVQTLATRDNSPTLIRQNHLLACTFHPELTQDPRVHQLFLAMVQRATPPPT